MKRNSTAALSSVASRRNPGSPAGVSLNSNARRCSAVSEVDPEKAPNQSHYNHVAPVGMSMQLSAFPPSYYVTGASTQTTFSVVE